MKLNKHGPTGADIIEVLREKYPETTARYNDYYQSVPRHHHHHTRGPTMLKLIALIKLVGLIAREIVPFAHAVQTLIRRIKNKEKQ